MPLIRSRALTGLAVAVALGGACAPREQVPDTAPADQVQVVNIAYSPPTLRIDKGAEVVWVNQDDGVRHTVTSGLPAEDGVPGVSKGKPARPDGAFDGDLPNASADFRFTFERAGTFAYFCRVHPSMTGEIVVE